MNQVPPTLEKIEKSFQDKAGLTELNARTWRVRVESEDWVVKFGQRAAVETAQKNNRLVEAVGLPTVAHHTITPLNGLAIPDKARAHAPPDALTLMPFVPAYPCDKTWKEMPPRKISEFCWHTLQYIPQVSLACLHDFAHRNVLCVRQKLEPVFVDMEAGFFSDPKFYSGRDDRSMLVQSHGYLRKSAALYFSHTLGDKKDRRERFTLLMLNGCDMLDKKINDPESPLMTAFGEHKDYFLRRVGSMREALTDPNLNALIFND